jgi:dTDP-4-amino-4,6-dideoxygalactose transaminase
MSSPDLTEAELAAVMEVLKTPHLSLGPRLEAFERALAAYVGAPCAVGVNSGTSGLHLAVIAAGVGEGDEVITTPFSFVASANCVLYERGTPVFVDVDPQTGNLNPALIERALTPRTKAILPVHAFGQPADMDPILDLARAHGLAVIEDACEAFGATYKGRPAGTLGEVGVFAFYPNKQMTTGEGGMLVTAREDWEALFRSLRNQGRDVFNRWLQHARLGYNYRLDEMSAALGLAQLRRIDKLLRKREQVAGWYNTRLQNAAGVHLPSVAPTTTRTSWFVYVIRLAPSIRRDKVMDALEDEGIPSRPYFSPIHLQPFYVERFGYRPGDFPVAEALGESCLALPFSSVMTEAQVDDVCQTLMRALVSLI